MTKITTLDKTTLRALGHAIEQALKAVGDEHGVVLSYAGGSYERDGQSAVVKINAALVLDGGVVASRERTAFTTHARLFGFSESDLDRTVVIGGVSYVITGLNPNALKRPVLAKNVKTGKTYVFPAGMVRTALGIVLPAGYVGID